MMCGQTEQREAEKISVGESEGTIRMTGLQG